MSYRRIRPLGHPVRDHLRRRRHHLHRRNSTQRRPCRPGRSRAGTAGSSRGRPGHHRGPVGHQPEELVRRRGASTESLGGYHIRMYRDPAAVVTPCVAEERTRLPAVPVRSMLRAVNTQLGERPFQHPRPQLTRLARAAIGRRLTDELPWWWCGRNSPGHGLNADRGVRRQRRPCVRAQPARCPSRELRGSDPLHRPVRTISAAAQTANEPADLQDLFLTQTVAPPRRCNLTSKNYNPYRSQTQIGRSCWKQLALSASIDLFVPDKNGPGGRQSVQLSKMSYGRRTSKACVSFRGQL